MSDTTEELRSLLCKQWRETLKLYSLELHPTASSILDKGAAMIVSGGGTALTMRAVAKEADIKLASLQYHFKTFDEFVSTLFCREFGRIARHTWETLERLEAQLLRPADVLRRAAESCMPEENCPPDGEHGIYFHLMAFCSYNKDANIKAKSFYRFYNTLFAYLISKVNPSLTAAQCTARAILITSTLEGAGIYTILKAGGALGDKTCHQEIGDLVVHYATLPGSTRGRSPAETN